MRRGVSLPPEPLFLLMMVRGRGLRFSAFREDGKHNTDAPTSQFSPSNVSNWLASCGGLLGQMVLAGVPGRRSSGSVLLIKVSLVKQCHVLIVPA